MPYWDAKLSKSHDQSVKHDYDVNHGANYSQEEDNDDDGLSCSSSALFELDNNWSHSLETGSPFMSPLDLTPKFCSFLVLAKKMIRFYKMRRSSYISAYLYFCSFIYILIFVLFIYFWFKWAMNAVQYNVGRVANIRIRVYSDSDILNIWTKFHIRLLFGL